MNNGKNTIGAILGNGFYNERGGRYHKLLTDFGPQTLRLRLVISYERQTDEIITDDSWQYALSPITFNSIYGGEDYDARLEIPQWNCYTVDKSKTLWHPVVIQKAPNGLMRPQIAEPVKIMETYAVKSIKKLSDSTLVLDMGQNLAGYPQITASGKRGQKIKLVVSETLTDEGTCNQKQTGRPYYYVYTFRGSKEEKWHPRFSYYGFQYIQVEGAVMKGQPNPHDFPVINDIHSCFVYNSAKKTGTFECSNSLFNEIYRIIDRAIRSNWQSVWTDCPHREKLGWLEQDWLNGEGLVYNYDARTMIEQTMQNIADAQHDNGAVPTTAPEYVIFKGKWLWPFAESPEWGGAFVALPFLYLSHYGDDKLIRQYYEPMKRYVDYLATQDSAYILKQGLGDWYDYGPGRAGFAKNTPMPLVATAHYYKWNELMTIAASIMKREDDALRFDDRANKIKNAFNHEFYHLDTHQYGTGSQTANAIALDMKLVSDNDRQAVLMNLIDDIHKHGDRLTTGDVGNRYLFNVLDKNGQHELLYKMLNHYDVPGYGFQIKKGMTTLTEQWNPEMGASMNHFMMGHINNLLIPTLVGINVNGKSLDIAPHPVGDITWCKGSTECAWGTIVCDWKIKNNEFVLNVNIPEQAVAYINMPSGKQFIANSGKHKYKESYK